MPETSYIDAINQGRVLMVVQAVRRTVQLEEDVAAAQGDRLWIIGCGEDGRTAHHQHEIDALLAGRCHAPGRSGVHPREAGGVDMQPAKNIGQWIHAFPDLDE